MTPPPPKKKSAPPARPNRNYDRAEPRQNGIRFQINNGFESEAELKKYIYDNLSEKGTRRVTIIKTFKRELIFCYVELEDKK